MSGFELNENSIDNLEEIVNSMPSEGGSTGSGRRRAAGSSGSDGKAGVSGKRTLAGGIIIGFLAGAIAAGGVFAIGRPIFSAMARTSVLVSAPNGRIVLASCGCVSA